MDLQEILARKDQTPLQRYIHIPGCPTIHHHNFVDKTIKSYHVILVCHTLEVQLFLITGPDQKACNDQQMRETQPKSFSVHLNSPLHWTSTLCYTMQCHPSASAVVASSFI